MMQGMITLSLQVTVVQVVLIVLEWETNTLKLKLVPILINVYMMVQYKEQTYGDSKFRKLQSW